MPVETIEFETVTYESRDGTGVEFRHRAGEIVRRQKVLFKDRELVFPDDFVRVT